MLGFVQSVKKRPGRSLLEAIQMWHTMSTRAYCDDGFRMAITWWGGDVWREVKRTDIPASGV